MRNLLIVFAFVTATAHAQYCVGYAKEYDITIQAGSITGTLPNYTMLVSGTYPYLGVGVGFATSTLGYDITFNQAGTPLTWNMPIYVSATGQIKANVLIPAATVGTVVSMCVGKASITTFRGGAAPYDGSTHMALQFPAASPLLDSDGQQTVTNHGATHVTTGPTYLVDAMSFDGSATQYLDMGATPGFPTVYDVTMSFWTNPVSTASIPAFVSYGSLGDRQHIVAAAAPGMLMHDGGGQAGGSSTPVTVGEWHKWDITTTAGGDVKYNLDGAANGSGSFGHGMAFVLGTSGIGKNVGNVNWLNGQIAEVRVSEGLRSASWIAAEFLNQSNPSAFYTIVAGADMGIPPVLSAVTITANSPLSVKAVWTTDVPSNSQVSCGTVSGGPYTYASSIVNPNVNNWNVKAHSMASNPMPNGPKYCIVTSVNQAGSGASSSEVGPINLPALPVSVPIMMVNPNVPVKSKLGDRFNGTNGAPKTGAWSLVDSAQTFWGADGNDYFSGGIQWPEPPNLLPFGTVRFTDAAHTQGTLVGWPYPTTTAVNNPQASLGAHVYWGGGGSIEVNHFIYWSQESVDAPFANKSMPLMKSNWITSVSPEHNFGPDTSYITSMTCNAADGKITALSKLNITDEPQYLLPGTLAIKISGAVGTNVNGDFNTSVVPTPTSISWINPGATCAGWSWSPTGGTGNGGGLIEGDFTEALTPGMALGLTWVHNDGPGYENGSKQAGMDAFIYGWMLQTGGADMGLFRMRVEDLPLQDWSKASYYVGHQLGDDGIYESAWDYTHAKATEMNPAEFAVNKDGKGAWQPKSQYLTDLHRFILAESVPGFTDATAGGTAIYDAGPYPWSPLTLIGSAQRNPDVYWHSHGPEFPQFTAKSQSSADGVTSINLVHAGGNFGVNFGDPTANEYDMYMNVDVQFVAKGATVAKPLVPGEVTSGLDLAYNFDSPTGAFSMPNQAPTDAKQRWAWKSSSHLEAVWTDPYGSVVHAAPSKSSAGGAFPSKSFHNIVFQTPYAEALAGPLTLMNCFGQYPAALLALPNPGAIVLKKGTDLSITWAGALAGAVTLGTGGTVTNIAVLGGGSGYTSPPTITITGDFRTTSVATAVGVLTGDVLTSITVTNPGSGYAIDGIGVIIPEPTNNWNVNFLGTSVGNVAIPSNTIGCVVVRRDSSNRVSLYTSAGIGKSLPLTASATATVVGPWTTSQLVIGDGATTWGTPWPSPPPGNSFRGSESLLRVWSRDLADDELISEMSAVRDLMWSRGKASAIPAPVENVLPPPIIGSLILNTVGMTTMQAVLMRGPN